MPWYIVTDVPTIPNHHNMQHHIPEKEESSMTIKIYSPLGCDARMTLLPLTWRQLVPPKSWYLFTKLQHHFPLQPYLKQQLNNPS
jgi:hypothetical protein